MRFFTIVPKFKTTAWAEADKPQDLYLAVGIDPDQVDHGIVIANDDVKIAIVVDDMGLRRSGMAYFSIGTKLYAGGAVLYQFDEAGETVTMTSGPPPVMFYRGAEDVENAIVRGEIKRPIMAVNGEVLWQWSGTQS